MNLRKVGEINLGTESSNPEGNPVIVGDYDIGLDLGTNSVGWAAVDSDGSLLRFKGRPTWGSRLFSKGNTAADTRIKRGQRRRYIRRRWRLNLLQELFFQEMEKVDKDFFLRMNQSRLQKDDRKSDCRDYHYPFFNGSDFTERDYYKKFPTIYHLRYWLMTTEEKADIRLIYLAFHNIVKHRGNFLRQGQDISSRNANMGAAIKGLCEAITDWAFSVDSLGESFEIGQEAAEAIAKELDPKTEGSPKDKSKRIPNALGFPSSEKKRAEAIARGILGLSCDVKTLFGLEEIDELKISLSKDEDVDAFVEICPDEGAALFAAMRDVHAAYVLQGLLSLREGEGISANKIAEYERYAADLSLLKELVKSYVPEKYDEFFRGPVYSGTHDYDASKAQGYTKYNLIRHKLGSPAAKEPYDAFKKDVNDLFEGSAAKSDKRYEKMMKRFEAEEMTFLRRLKTSDNGSIYYQLHLEEMNAIIDNQARFYPFLMEQRDKLTSLVEFRIPYYVGPLQQKNAAINKRTQEKRFAWSERKPGMENVAIKPWNWDEIIDKHKSAEAFIKRMTGTCTYLRGEPVLPKCSLLYEEFCVLNELNGARMTTDGDNSHRIEAFSDRMRIIDELFHKGNVSYKKVEDWLRKNHTNAHVGGGQGETGFESRMGSYIFFSKDIFDGRGIPEEAIPMVEEIILWSTLFEDKDILEEKIKEKYGDKLSDDKIKKIRKKPFSGWGRLSKKFLTGIKVETDEGPKSIIQIMREGNPNNGQRSRPMVLMEILHDDDFGFERAIEKENRKFSEEQGGLTVDDLPGSPALRRGVNQALRIVDEIAHIAGKPPAHIYIEVTRDEDARNKGKRTTQRDKALAAALDSLKKESFEIWDANDGEGVKADLKQWTSRLNDERVMLYFVQCGRSMYSDESIDINQLFDSNMYEVDHILPRAYIKDDSLENKALVLRKENQLKTDSLLLSPSIQKKQRGFWEALKKAKLIGEKKYKNLMRDDVNDGEMRGFIARQLVETSQIVKFTGEMLRNKYPNTKVQPIKAAMSSQLRDRYNFVKCREINDFHHAHDAFLACRIGQFIQLRHPGVFDNPIVLSKSIRQFVKQQSEEFGKTRRMPGSASYIVESFARSTGFDPETGEVDESGVLWDAKKAEDSIRRSLNYKDCFISRMPEETTGAFWKETLYSPKRKASNPLRIKGNLEIDKYGYYSDEELAYFVIYQAEDSKGKKKNVFCGIPIPVARDIKNGEADLDSFVCRDAEKRLLRNPSVKKKRILKYALVEQEENRYYVPALDAVYSARQLALSSTYVGIAAAACDIDKVPDANISQADLIDLYDVLLSKSTSLCAKFEIVRSHLEKGRSTFLELSIGEKRLLLKGLLGFFRGERARVDLSKIGGPKNAGAIKSGFLFSGEKDLFFIDQSVTGMFERRYRLEL